MTETSVMINGRRFVWKRITLAMQYKISKKFSPTRWQAIGDWLRSNAARKYLKLNPDTTRLDLIKNGLIKTDRKERIRDWKKLRSIAFVRTGTWKWLGIIPVELRIKNMDENAGGLKADFSDDWRRW